MTTGSSPRGGRFVRAALLATAGVVGLCPMAQAARPTATVALSARPATGVTGATYGSFAAPVINASGDVAFVATLSEPAPETGNLVQGIWMVGAGGVDLIALEGRPAPGMEEVLRGVFQDTVGLSDTGVIVFEGETAVPGDSRLGIWGGRLGHVRLFTGDDAPAPGTATNFNAPGGVGIGASGDVILHTWIADVDHLDSSLWSGQTDSLELIAREGEAAPEAGGAVFTSLFPDSPGPAFAGVTVGEDGNVGFAAALLKPDATRSSGLFAGPPGSVRLLAREGDPAPGTVPGTRFGEFGRHIDLALANDGALFLASAKDGAGRDVDGLWIASPGTIRPVAVQGQPAPDGNGSYSYFMGRERDEYLYNGFDINEAGQIAFLATVSDDEGTPFTGLFGGRPDDTRLLVRSGQSLPGMEAIEVGFSRSPGDGIVLNERGQVAFLGSFRDRVSGTEGSAIYATMPDGALVSVVRAGELLEVSPGDFRTIADLSFNYFDVTSNGLSDAGEIAFVAEFTDGSSGVFVVVVPEPQTWLALSLVTVTMRRTRRPRCA